MSLPPPGSFALHLLDVGQGESILLDLPNGDFALIDAGPSSAAKMILTHIEERIDAGGKFRFAALTHWDADHIGALPGLMRRHPPLEFVRPNIDMSLIERLCGAYEKQITPALLADLRDATREIAELPLGARQSIPDVGRGVEIYALSPAATVRKRLEEAVEKNPRLAYFKRLRNDASLVLWIRAFGRALLLPGEISIGGADELAAQFGGPEKSGRIHHDDLRALWIKLGHHGSKTGTDTELLRIFGHDNFIASASHGAQYGHPHPRALHAVRECNGKAMCTNLGKGCRLIIEHPEENPADNPSWSDKIDWDREPALKARCYGTVTVIVSPDGECTVMGSNAERKNCPYGGPPDGRVVLPLLST